MLRIVSTRHAALRSDAKGFDAKGSFHFASLRQSVRQSPALERILSWVRAGHMLILRGCPALIGPTTLRKRVVAGHSGRAKVPGNVSKKNSKNILP